jgi:hypothetical protein
MTVRRAYAPRYRRDVALVTNDEFIRSDLDMIGE